MFAHTREKFLSLQRLKEKDYRIMFNKRRLRMCRTHKVKKGKKIMKKIMVLAVAMFAMATATFAAKRRQMQQQLTT